MRVIVALLVIVELTLICVPQPVQAQGDESAWLLAQINALRTRKGLNPLIVNAQLASAAAAHSTYLATTIYADPHRERDGSTPQSRALAAGYTGKVAENVVGGSQANAEWGFNWWVNSPVHLNNILWGWTEIGIGVAEGPMGKWYTADFGAQGAQQIVPTSSPAPAGPDAPPGTSVVNPPAATDPANAAAPQKQNPLPPTRRPTRLFTFTPTITVTPSITYTPRATFTATFTQTSLPPTVTAIVMEVSPQPSLTVNAAMGLGTTVPILTPGTAIAMIPTPQIIALPAPTITAKPGASDTIRSLIPWAIGLQIFVVGGLATRSLFRRRRR